jgi:tRNA(Ile)-lysidine synthase
MLAHRVERVERALVRVMDHARNRLTSMPWPDRGPITIEADAWADLPPELALRLLGQAIAFTGDEGPVQLAKLEALYAALSGAGGSGGIRRTLAGAVISLSDGRLTVDRAPPRRNRLTTQPFGRPKKPKHR